MSRSLGDVNRFIAIVRTFVVVVVVVVVVIVVAIVFVVVDMLLLLSLFIVGSLFIVRSLKLIVRGPTGEFDILFVCFIVGFFFTGDLTGGPIIKTGSAERKK